MCFGTFLLSTKATKITHIRPVRETIPTATMTSFHHDDVNMAFALICPELKSRYAACPIPEQHGAKWLSPSATAEFEGKPIVVLAEKDDGPKEDHICCKRGPIGAGHCHVLCRTSCVNLYTRLQKEGNGLVLGCLSGDRKHAGQWDTCRHIVCNHSRASRPDDADGAEKAIDHMEGSELPGHGLKLKL